MKIIWNRSSIEIDTDVDLEVLTLAVNIAILGCVRPAARMHLTNKGGGTGHRLEFDDVIEIEVKRAATVFAAILQLETEGGPQPLRPTVARVPD